MQNHGKGSMARIKNKKFLNVKSILLQDTCYTIGVQEI